MVVLSKFFVAFLSCHVAFWICLCVGVLVINVPFLWVEGFLQFIYIFDGIPNKLEPRQNVVLSAVVQYNFGMI